MIESLERNRHFVVTKDHLNGVSMSHIDKASIKLEGFTVFTQCYDDDDVLYYSGYVHEEADEFVMIDWAEYDSGCTYCKQRDNEGMMSHL